MSIFGKKKREQNAELNANEQVVVLSIIDGWLRSDIWVVEDLWNYMAACYKGCADIYGLMDIPQNEYALGRAELWGMRNERKDKYGR